MILSLTTTTSPRANSTAKGLGLSLIWLPTIASCTTHRPELTPFHTGSPILVMPTALHQMPTTPLTSITQSATGVIPQWRSPNDILPRPLSLVAYKASVNHPHILITVCSSSTVGTVNLSAPHRSRLHTLVCSQHAPVLLTRVPGFAHTPGLPVTCRYRRLM